MPAPGSGLAGSCNPYFFHIGFALFNYNQVWLSDTAHAFGLGQAGGIEVDAVVQVVGGVEPIGIRPREDQRVGVGHLLLARAHRRPRGAN